MSKSSVRFITLLMVLCLALPLAGIAAQPSDTLVVASTTGMSGEFMAGMWGNNTTDVDIRLLLHDYPTVLVGLDEQARVNDLVIRQHSVHQDAVGNLVHTFTLRGDLRFSDGSRITAQDYLFSLLLASAPAVKAIDGSIVTHDHLLGSDAYVAGETAVFSGLRLLGDRQFSLTIKKEFLPYYYNLELVQVQPYPLAAIAPGCQVKDEGSGAYIAGEFTPQLLEKTILDPDNGYLSRPSVSSGAYKIVSHDAAKRVAVFQANPYYLGNRQGLKPAIQRIEVREIRNADIAQALQSGAVHLVNKITAADSIDAVRALPGHVVQSQAYPRNGLAYLSFSVERDLPASLTLRKAVARMLDKEALIERILRGYGQPVHAYYGLGQWMAKDAGVDLAQLNKHPFDLNAAAALLAEDGWTLDSAGNAYDPQAGGLRHKRMGETLQPLVLKLALPQDSPAGDAAADLLDDSLAKLGGKLALERLNIHALLRQYYRQDERQFDLMFLASNFGFVFDPYYSYHTSDAHQGTQNISGLKDEQLMALAGALRETTPGDKASYLARWLDFQRHWSDVLPLVPLYTNTYYDAFTTRLTNYHPERYHSWADAILYAELEPER